MLCKRVARATIACNCLIRVSYDSSSRVAVGALADEDVDVLDDRRVGEEPHVAPAEVAGEEEAAVAAVLAEVELHHRRAEDVAGVVERQVHAGEDLAGLGVGDALEPLDDPLDVGQVEQGLDRAVLAVAQVAVARILALDPGAVAEHDAEDVGRGVGGQDRPVVAGPDQAGEAADVVVVGVRDDHRVEVAGVERELAVRAVRVHPVGVEQAAIEQDPRPADLHQVGAARHLLRRAMERDAQPIILPPVHPPTVGPPPPSDCGRSGRPSKLRRASSRVFLRISL